MVICFVITNKLILKSAYTPARLYRLSVELSGVIGFKLYSATALMLRLTHIYTIYMCNCVPTLEIILFTLFDVIFPPTRIFNFENCLFIGAASTHFHVIAPSTRGFYQRAIIMSGGALHAWSYYELREHLLYLFNFGMFIVYALGNNTVKLPNMQLKLLPHSTHITIYGYRNIIL